MSLWDIVQQVQIENLKARQVSGESEAERAAGRSRALGAEVHDRIEHLALVTEAMWELMLERFGVTVADLAARVRDIDARDGHIDGRRGVVADAPAIRCPSCQAVVPAGKTACQFCGADVPAAKADPFRL